MATEMQPVSLVLVWLLLHSMNICTPVLQGIALEKNTLDLIWV